METVRVAVALSVCLSVLCQGQSSQVLDEENAAASALGLSQRELVDVLDQFLDDEDRELSVQKKASVIPRCDVGERCALKHGPRIGRLCDCLRGTACNSFFLRCY
ncbi:cocaine- and amphetamine-regulated transcript 4 [Eucyclogobius newberryi]|uniref:cocaine- and amphetamine-regulated transcript 4 n=1 Tax=Eucyclogobius newberryi TaxID=166745 RepID=UPI003B5A1099